MPLSYNDLLKTTIKSVLCLTHMPKNTFLKKVGRLRTGRALFFFPPKIKLNHPRQDKFPSLCCFGEIGGSTFRIIACSSNSFRERRPEVVCILLCSDENQGPSSYGQDRPLPDVYHFRKQVEARLLECSSVQTITIPPHRK